MSFLVLGGTAWLGREVVSAALASGHEVTVLARGRSGAIPDGVEVVRSDRAQPGAYDAVSGRDWDGVIDVSRQPSQVRSAVAALGGRAAAWVFVSSASVYADHDQPGASEDAALLPAHEADDEGWETYGGRKVACETAVLETVGDRALIARSGLIAGPGDHTDRTGYWSLRFAHPAASDGAVLVPDSAVSTQVVDVRDLAAWLVHCAAERIAGLANVSGRPVPLPDHLAAARAVAGHRGELVSVPPDWLVAQGVETWAGDRSLPLWLPLPDYAGFMDRSTALARRLGLTVRPLEETLADTLEWELSSGPGRTRKAGLSPGDEVSLIDRARREGVARVPVWA
jgi:nucleoside-diphosphate-sugar epimerase